MDAINEVQPKNRVVFKDGHTVREGTVLEVSPARNFVKIKYVWGGLVTDVWFSITVLEEILPSESEE